MKILKQIPYIVILILIIVIAFKDCGGGRSNRVKTDTVEVTKTDTVFIEVSGSKESKPKLIKETDTIIQYLTVKDSCDKMHLNDKGLELIKYRSYQDTVQIEGYFVGYNASVLGRLESINLSLNGSVPQIKERTVRTVTNTIQRNNSIGAYAYYNRSLQVGLEYRQKNLSYSLNYDLEYQSVGVKIGYHPFNW